MGYTTGWYRNSKGKRVYGRHSTSPGYYNKYGKWVVGKKPSTGSGSSHGDHSHGGGSSSGGGNTTPAPSSREKPTDRVKAHGIFKAASTRLRDGGPSDSAFANANDNASFKRQLNFNLDNNEDKAQGSQHEWAQPTSISSLISGQLRQADNAPKDAWDVWAQNNGGMYSPSTAQEQQQYDPSAPTSQPMGAFGLNSVMNNYGVENQEYEQAAKGTFGGWGNATGNATGMQPFNSASDEAEFKGSAVYGVASSKAANTAAAALAAYNAEMAGVAAGSPQHTAASTKYWSAITAARNTYKSDYATWYNDTSPESAKVMNSSGVLTTSYKAAYAKKLAEDKKLAEEQKKAEAAQALKDKEAAAAQAERDRLAREAEAKRIADNKAAQEARATSAAANLKNYDTFGVPIQSDLLKDDAYVSNLYNPWGRMEGASQNRFGPSSDTMGKATMEAMAMANAYFAPQRAELAYELGDMETDMRRLAVNLGRQVDDPVLQAKLYKDGMRSVRTLDVQQNTFAFQLADARRKEENANFQFYDQLAQEEARMKLANRQFFESLDLQKNQYNLNAWGAANPVVPTYTGTTEAQQQQTQAGLLAKRKV